MTVLLQPGDEIDYTVTYLEMTDRPTAPPPPRPVNLNMALFAAVEPPVDYFLHLYGSVGAPYEWTDWFDAPRAELQDFVHSPKVSLYSLLMDGWPGGFFMLDSRTEGICDLAYFGLVPDVVGRGVGTWLLATAIETGWDRPGTERMTVNTCTLDHPRALGLYQRMGFVPVRREEQRRVLTRQREIAG